MLKAITIRRPEINPAIGVGYQKDMVAADANEE